MTWLTFLLLNFGLCWAAVGAFRCYAVEKGMMDQPGPRSSHIAPTPRGGGVIFFLGWYILLGVLYYFYALPVTYLELFLPAACIGLVGFWEDHFGLPITIRLLSQAVIASFTLFLIMEQGELLQSIINWPLPICFIILVLACVWLTNLFNFMDGSDGIATVQAMFIFGVGGAILFHFQAVKLGIMAWGLVALLGGFLTWNWPTARIFMGDCGSTFLGFLCAVYALVSYKFFHVPLIYWVLLASPFWFDATLTLGRRLLARQDIRKPHRLHAYQRLIQSGWSHQKVLLGLIFINMVISGLVLLAMHDPRYLQFTMGVTGSLLVFVYLVIELKKPMMRAWHPDIKGSPVPKRSELDL